MYRVLKHELTHVFIESYGFAQFNSFSEENVADFIECYGESLVELAKDLFTQMMREKE